LATTIVVSALIAFACAVARLLRGPTQADRIVALDVMFSSSIALSAAAALAQGAALFLDIGIGLSVTGFVATVLWARLIDASPRSPRTEASVGRADSGLGISTDEGARGSTPTQEGQ
jgi:multicomponent Na+:H+ antiporter subunit F